MNLTFSPELLGEPDGLARALRPFMGYVAHLVLPETEGDVLLVNVTPFVIAVKSVDSSGVPLDDEPNPVVIDVQLISEIHIY